MLERKPMPNGTNLFTTIPSQLKQYIFNMMDRSTLFSVANANKEFNQISNNVFNNKLNKYKNNIFYTVGKPIQISDPNRGLLDSGLWVKQRNKIPLIEIYDSFLQKNIQSVKLFKTEDEALEFSRYFRVGDQILEGTEVFQSAIFTVVYLGNVDLVDWKDEKMHINKGCWSTSTEWRERTKNIKFCEVERINVVALSGILKIHQSNLGEFINHGPLDYTKCKNLKAEDDEISVSCSIM